jgi:cryptochrome
VLDPWFVANANVGPNRWRFLKESLENLDSSLRKLGSRLFVVRGKPNQVFETIFEVFGGLTLSMKTP